MGALHAYNLAANPYEIKFDPLKDRGAERVVCVGGVRRIRDLDTFLDAKGSRYVLISGRSGTGRSTAARYLIWRWCDRRRVPLNHLLIPDLDLSEEGYDEFAQLRRWARSLGDLAEGENLQLNTVQRERDELKSGDLGADPDLTLQDTLKKLCAAIAGQGFACAALFDGVGNPLLIHRALKVFKNAGVIVVFTLDDYDNVIRRVAVPVLARFAGDDGERVELRLLEGADVRQLVLDRWRQDSPHDCPFDGDGIEQGFVQPRTIRSVLGLLAWMLDWKQSTTNGDLRWPADRAPLFWSRAELEKVDSMETSLEGYRIRRSAE
jgi:hypothetical protein